ncbi:MAG: hypothetical protein JNK68_08885 [Betaproteobacteria bacterium]|nr:hypothetical protein [Betaproteobacteria bacterium]
MNSRAIHRVGRFWVATKQRADGQWVAWAQITPIYSDEPVADSHEHIWLVSGSSREQATAKLKRELALPPYDAASQQERHRCWVMLTAASTMLVSGVLIAEPTLFFAGLVGVGHGLYSCVWLSERSDSGPA